MSWAATNPVTSMCPNFHQAEWPGPWQPAEHHALIYGSVTVWPVPWKLTSLANQHAWRLGLGACRAG